MCRARRNISPQPCHRVIKSKLTAATAPSSHQKENGVVKSNMRKSLLQTLVPCEISPKGQLSLLSSCCISIHGGLGCCCGLGMVQGLLQFLPNPAPSGNSSPTFLGFPGTFGVLVGVGANGLKILLFEMDTSSEVWM